jgi:outer membrane lipase/esterase
MLRIVASLAPLSGSNNQGVHMKKQTLQRVLVGLCLAFSAAAQASSFSSLVFFGDSLSDSGNNAVLVGSGGTVAGGDAYFSKIPYASGRYSNGPVWSEQFAAKMGLSATASLLGGTNYAFGGAQTGVDGTDGPGGFPFSMKTQLNMFLGGFAGNPAHAVSGSELFVVAGGGNNVRDVLANVSITPANAPQLIATAAAAYAQARGAQHILVMDTPNFGLTPSALSFGAPGGTLGSLVSASMNAALAARLAGESGVMNFDFYAFLTNTVANAASLGLTNVSNACGQAPVICDPATALFFDGIHPTNFGHTLLADAVFAQAVPEPASYLLLGSGLLLLVWLRRQRNPSIAKPAVLA